MAGMRYDTTLKVWQIVKDTRRYKEQISNISIFKEMLLYLSILNKRARSKTIGFVFSKFQESWYLCHEILSSIELEIFEFWHTSILSWFHPQLGKSHYRWVLVWPRKRSSRVPLSTRNWVKPETSSRGSLFPKHANGIGRRYKCHVVRCYGYPGIRRFSFRGSWKLNDSRERWQPLSSFFFFYYQGNIPIWRGTKVLRVRFLDEKVANASLRLRLIFDFFVLSPLPCWNGYCSDSKLFLVEVWSRNYSLEWLEGG